MSRLETTLVRLGAAELSKWLGQATIDLLDALDLKQLTSTHLAQLVVRQIGPSRLLLDSRYRNQLVSALPRADAETLCRLLGVSACHDPYEALCSTHFYAGHNRTDTLFSFFGLKPPLNTETGGPAPSSLVIPCYPLFDFQRGVCIKTLKLLSTANTPRVLLHMPTGSGKTRTAMAIVSSILRRAQAQASVVVWLAHSEELCDQAAEEFTRAWSAIGDRPLTIFRHYGPYRCRLDTIEEGFLVAGLQLLYNHSLSHQREFFILARRTNLVVMDEAHRAIAPSYRHVLNLLTPDPRTPLVGLSATPGRSWLNVEEDLELAHFFHHNKVTLQVDGYPNPIDYLQQQGYLAKVEYVRIPFSPDGNFTLTAQETEALRLGFDLPDSVILRLANNHKRNLLLLSSILNEARHQDAKIIVFACSVEHANLIANVLRLKGVAAAAVSSETPLDDRRRILEAFRCGNELQVISNYGVLTTGFDAPKTNVAVIARPTTSVVLYSQMVGRAIRGPKAGGNDRARVLTVIDEIPGFRSVNEGFMFWDDLWN